MRFGDERRVDPPPSLRACGNKWTRAMEGSQAAVKGLSVSESRGLHHAYLTVAPSNPPQDLPASRLPAWGRNEPETNIGPPAVGPGGVATGRSAGSAVVVPTAPATHAVRTCSRVTGGMLPPGQVPYQKYRLPVAEMLASGVQPLVCSGFVVDSIVAARVCPTIQAPESIGCATRRADPSLQRWTHPNVPRKTARDVEDLAAIILGALFLISVFSPPANTRRRPRLR